MRVTVSNTQLPSVERGHPITLHVDGHKIEAYEGETILGVMLAAGQRITRHTAKDGRPRGMFCGIGICYDCLVTVNGRPNMRACHTLAANGMMVETQTGGIND